MNASLSHRVNFIVVFTMSAVSGIFLLPFIRVQPALIHDFAKGLVNWQRELFLFSACLLYTYVLFKLFSPRIRHIRYFFSHPPTWFAWLLGSVAVAEIDLWGHGFGSGAYRGRLSDWGKFAVIPVVLVWCYRWLSAGAAMPGWLVWCYQTVVFWRKHGTKIDQPIVFKIESMPDAKWDDIEKWLRTEATAEYDILGNAKVAKKIADLVTKEGVKSIGLVGAFGAGKSSIINWMKRSINCQTHSSTRYFICEQSCWGFENSSSAIQEILAEAIKQIEVYVDTFHVSSLPESYRQTFSAGGEWLDSISSLVFGKSDYRDQFEQLSNLLSGIGAKLVIVVEDLDRNDSRTFDIQEVLAFLNQLKRYENLVFVLSGGLRAKKLIDFSKLCDHIEYSRTIQPHHATALVTRVFDHCHDPTRFEHTPLYDIVEQRHQWTSLSWLLLKENEELSFPQAVALLLDTPRSLRHVLGRTLNAWHSLYGEINFNHLLAVNVLRHATPEAFDFVKRRWDRLKSPPDQKSLFGPEKTKLIRNAVLRDWKRTVKKAEWNPTAALRIIQFLLPATEYWLIDDSNKHHYASGRQLPTLGRYWARALNEEIEDNDVTDQEVVRDIMSWKTEPIAKQAMIEKLSSNPIYCRVWEEHAISLLVTPSTQLFRLNDSDRNQKLLEDRIRMRLLCEQVLRKSFAVWPRSTRDNSTGVIAAWGLSKGTLAQDPANLPWVKGLISEASKTSIESMNRIREFFGNADGYSILRKEDGEELSQHVLATLRHTVTDGPTLDSRLSPRHSAALYQLVFARGHEGDRARDVCSWAWLGPHIVVAMKNGSATAAANCSVLLDATLSSRSEPKLNIEVLNAFFGDQTAEAINLLETLIKDLPESERESATRIVQLARQYNEQTKGPKSAAEETDREKGG